MSEMSGGMHVKERDISILAHFDGKVFVPDEPVCLPKGKTVRLAILPKKKRRTTVGKGKRRLNYELGSNPIPGGAKDGAEHLDRYVYRSL